MMSLPAGARGDGDPASDVLVSQTLFLPADANVPPRLQAELGAILGAAERARYPIRVALIASPTDMGSVTELWRQPENYARFLGQELSLAYNGRVLVVMPGGLGLSFSGAVDPNGERVLAQTASATSAAGAAQAAISSVLRLAAQAGHPLQVPAGVAARTTGGGSASSDIVGWIVFAAGGFLVAAAWAASLRARPLRIHRAPG